MSFSTTSVNLFELAKKAMRERGFLIEFSPAVDNEINQIKSPLTQSSPPIANLTDKLWFSIDNDDSKDLDQITCAEIIDQNRFKIFVAIADVDSLVTKGSAIDLYAQHNTVSVYTPPKTFTMLPTKLSYDFTSLIENQERQAVVVEIEIDQTGLILKYITYQAVVKNKAKLAYNSLASWLEGKGPMPDKLAQTPNLPEQIQLQDKISKYLRQYRINHGAILFGTEEIQPIVKNGQVVAIDIVIENRARHLIEDFMITANTGIARFLRDKKIPSLRRVVRTPKRWDRIVEIAKTYGEVLPADPDSKSLENFLVKRKEQDPLNFSELSLTLIKLLGRGEYIVEYPDQKPVGHFNLSINYYTHFTAPNRRYIDLLNQRILKAVLNGKQIPYTSDELESLAKYCTLKEDDAAKVERQTKKSASILFISSKMNQTFDGIVTGAGQNGTWVHTFTPPIDGRVVQGYEHLDVGDKTKVTLIHVDVEKGFIDFKRTK